MAYNVMLVDDVSLNRRLMKSILDRSIEDVVFSEAVDGIEAMEMVEYKEYDLIILDLMMPRKDGYEVLEELKTSDKHKDIPIIVNSALDGIDSIKKALAIGADEYFIKPLTLEQMEVILPLKVKNVLTKNEQRKNINKLNGMLQKELDLARIFQESLMSETCELDKYDINGKHIASREVGGDFFEYIEVDNKLYFIIADVYGKGVMSAMIASMIKVKFNLLVELNIMPNEILDSMNNFFCDLFKGKLPFTAFVGMIEDYKLYYSNGGQTYPIIIDENGEYEVITNNNSGIGFIKDVDYDLFTKEMKKEDTIMLYTNGIFKTQKPYIDIEKYEYIIKEDVQALVDILTEILLFDVEESYEDDISVMTIRIK